MAAIGGCYSFGILVHFQPGFDYGAQGVYKGSVWTVAVLRNSLRDWNLVFRRIKPQKMLMS